MKKLPLLLASSLLAACAASEPAGELDESTDATAEKDDGSRELQIHDTLPIDGQDHAMTKVFTTAAAYQAFFGTAAPAQVDFATEYAIYYAAGPKNTGGYEANVLKVTLSASGKTITVSTETVSPGNTCLVTQALTSPATLVTVKKQPTVTRFSSRHKDFSLACSAVCGDDLAAQLSYGARGALYMSEGDEPYTPVAWAGAGNETLTKARFLTLLNRAATTNIDESDWNTWITEMTTVDANADDFEKEAAQQYSELREIVERQLTDIKVFDVGAQDNGDGVRPLYIVGKTSCGDLAGLKTTIVAT
jgi:hypothetical protein